MDTHKYGNKEKPSIDRFSLFTCKLSIKKILLEIKTLIEKSSLVILTTTTARLRSSLKPHSSLNIYSIKH